MNWTSTGNSWSSFFISILQCILKFVHIIENYLKISLMAIKLTQIYDKYPEKDSGTQSSWGFMMSESGRPRFPERERLTPDSASFQGP